MPVEANSLAVIDTKANGVVDDIPFGTKPGPVTRGEGSIWVGNVDDKSVTRIDANTRKVVRNIPLNHTPTGLAFGFGEVWIAHGHLATSRRSTRSSTPLGPPIQVGGTAFGQPYGSVAVAPGAVWVVLGDSTLAKIDPTTLRVERARAGSVPASIAVGSDSIWVSNSGEASVTRYNPEAFHEPVGTINVGRSPTGIAAADAVWVANSADDSVWRIDPDSSDVDPIDVGDDPRAVAVTPDAVWVANHGDGTLSRIDLASNKVERIMHIGNAPTGIVFADGLLWVTVQAPT